MRSFSFWLGAAALLSGVNCQVTSRYCDQLGRCFISRTTQSGIVVGIALPEVQVAPFDVILQVTAPIEIGWAGFSWGGGMSYTPLAITWANGNSVKISSRMAYTYSLPTAYEGSTYTLLEGSYVNATHFVTTALCKGCTAWDATGAGERRLDPAGSNTLAAAWSYQPVTDPSRIDTTFAIHQGFDMWGQSFAPGRSPNFNRWATGGSGGSATTSATISPPASSTLLASTTAVSSSTRAAVPLPSSCGLQSRFPLRSAQGWSWLKIAGSLTNPRGVVVDSRGNLLVVQTGRGVTVHTFRQDGCIASSKTLVNKPALNHGITLSPDGRRLIVSSLVSAFRYDYDPVSQTATNEQVVVKGMEPGGHPTRTAVIPPGAPDLLILSVGSNGNLDGPSLNKGVGRALVKVFNLTSVPSGGFDYRTSGWFLGYGLRNEVAIVVDNNNKVWGVENSADDFTRTVNGVVTDIHEDNPAEELNFLGDPSVANEGWYGYPTCFTVWGGAQFPDGRPAVGSQFVPAPNSTWNDARCERESIPPRLSLQAHSAPLDGKFDRNNQNMYVTLHGSWNRRVPTGFKVVEIPFRLGGNGQYEPVAARDSTTGYRDVLWDPQQGCSMMNCFRPSGLTWDRDFTRMYIASDNVQEGEIYLLAKTG